MKRITILMFMIILTISLVSADTYVVNEITADNDMYIHEELNTGNNIYANFNLDSEGDNYVWIDGLGFDETVNDLRLQDTKTMNDFSVATLISYSTDLVKYGTEKYANGEQVLHHNPHNEELMIANSLSSTFLTYNQGNYLLSKFDEINMKLEAMEKTLKNIDGAYDTYCENMIDISKEYGLETVKCDDTNWYSSDIGTLGIKKIQSPVKVQETPQEEKEGCQEGKSLCNGVCQYECVIPAKVYEPKINCEEWSECLNNSQVRTCKKVGYINPFTQERSCDLVTED